MTSSRASKMLIEIRLMPGKYKIKEIINRIRRGCGLKNKKIVPHMTIYGPYVKLSNLQDVSKAVERVAKRYDTLPFLIDGYGHNKSTNGNVISLNIRPSESLSNFRREICRELRKVAPSCETWDTIEDPFWFHITISHRMSDVLFEKVWKSINRKDFRDDKGYFIQTPHLPLDGIRVTCINDKGRIRFEYDLLQKRIFSRREALDKSEWSRSLKIYRKKRGFEFKETKSKSGIFLLSDLHLGHTNIIRYCARPFSSAREMDEVLINNWNKTVKQDDEIYYLGDLTLGSISGDAHTYLNRLNGRITYVGGNHDNDIPDMKNHAILEYKKHAFLLVHDPNKIPIDWDGWIIHGDKHNNNVLKYPFINGTNKTINVSAELVNYQPLDIETLIKLSFEKIERMDTLSSPPIFFKQYQTRLDNTLK